ncbi:MAG: hypothetical protein LBI66_07930 [Burkholderiaceae bacterium]|jgi:hypothetical protein|nr:hypothetical protein [Burkholderiaceae bacterium]
MSNVLYPKGAQKILGKQIDFGNDAIKAAIVPSGYTFSTAHEFLNELGTTVGTAQSLANKSITGGVFDADDVAFGAIAAGPTLKGVVLFVDTGNATTSPLIAYLDEVTGFPMIANGGAVKAEWNDGSGKILALV